MDRVTPPPCLPACPPAPGPPTLGTWEYRCRVGSVAHEPGDPPARQAHFRHLRALLLRGLGIHELLQGRG